MRLAQQARRMAQQARRKEPAERRSHRPAFQPAFRTGSTRRRPSAGPRCRSRSRRRLPATTQARLRAIHSDWTRSLVRSTRCSMAAESTVRPDVLRRVGGIRRQREPEPLRRTRAAPPPPAIRRTGPRRNVRRGRAKRPAPARPRAWASTCSYARAWAQAQVRAEVRAQVRATARLPTLRRVPAKALPPRPGRIQVPQAGGPRRPARAWSRPRQRLLRGWRSAQPHPVKPCRAAWPCPDRSPNRRRWSPLPAPRPSRLTAALDRLKRGEARHICRRKRGPAGRPPSTLGRTKIQPRGSLR